MSKYFDYKKFLWNSLTDILGFQYLYSLSLIILIHCVFNFIRFFYSTAFCKNDKQKKWYKFDDHTVSSLDKSDVRSSAAYILFYSAIPDINNMISR